MPFLFFNGLQYFAFLREGGRGVIDGILCATGYNAYLGVLCDVRVVTVSSTLHA